MSNISTDDRNIAMIAHLLGILTGFLGGLIIWLIHKDKPEKAFVNEQAKEALNFQITVLLAWIAAVVLSFVGIGLLLFPVIIVVNIVFCILAGISVSSGNNYRYPIALRLIN